MPEIIRPVISEVARAKTHFALSRFAPEKSFLETKSKAQQVPKLPDEKDSEWRKRVYRSTVEFKINPQKELTFGPHVTEALRGTVVKTEDKDGKPVYIITEGSGQFGLEHMEDNINKAGIIDHSLKTGRVAAHFARLMQMKGHVTDPQRIFETMAFSHAGRFLSDDMKNHPNETIAIVGEEEAERRRAIPNEHLGLDAIKNKVPIDQYELIAALGHKDDIVQPKTYESLDHELEDYSDHRITDKYMRLNKRMGNRPRVGKA